MIFNLALILTTLGLLGIIFCLPLGMHALLTKRQGNAVEKYRYWSAYQH